MDILGFFRRLFDTSEKEIAGLKEIVTRINELEPSFKPLSPEALRAKTTEFRNRLADGETLDDLLPEAFAACREAGRRMLNMRHFDVQLMGGIVLHHGRIAEMRTGEGKTLVATLALYLNALEGKGVHLVTVNDYLARRDAVWMGAIYHALGLSVGIIQGHSADSDELGGTFIYEPGYVADDPRYMHCRACARQEAYLADITYGTNHEFGFDYLRDNMAFDTNELNLRELNYAIIDEVDSILIDEARTPHIIAGAVQEDVSRYKKTDSVIRRLNIEKDFTVDEKTRSVVLTEEGIDRVEQLLGIPNLSEDPEEMHYVNSSLKAYGIFHKDKEYVVKNGEIIIVDEFTGRLMFGRRYSDGLHQAIEAKEGVPIRQENQTIAVVTFQNLFRLYKKLAGMTGTAKTEEDEFRKIYGLDVVTAPTNKPMVRDDRSDVVYKTEEAKFRGISMELLRLYAKQQPVLVGTRSIEMSEKLSKRLTSDRLQALCAAFRIIEHMEKEKNITKDKRNEYKQVVYKKTDQLSLGQLNQIARELSINVKMTDAENILWLRNRFTLDETADEFLDEALRHGIPHNILNAKFHEKEALIIAEAGVKGRVTIATNMAGRGVDILLGGTILPEDLIRQRDEQEKMDAAAEYEANAGLEVNNETVNPDQTSERADSSNPFAAGVAEEDAAGINQETYVSFRRGGRQRAAPPLPIDQQERSKLAEEVRKLGGIYILGTERHESRRIDNQLRGRAGRQGDPGESQFFLSLEDELMRLFGDKANNPLLRTWPEDEPIQARLISSMIENAQKRIEFQNFQSRKHVLEYDDVLNVQRELIYKERKAILQDTADLPAIILGYIDELIDEKLNLYCEERQSPAEYDLEGLLQELNRFFNVEQFINAAQLSGKKRDAIAETLKEIGRQAYQKRLEEYGEELLHKLERWRLLVSTNNKWMEHLAQMDYLREGINLRGYAQQDPLIAYKKEAFDIFKETMANIRDETITWVFHAQIQQPVQQRPAIRINEAGASQSTGMRPVNASDLNNNNGGGGAVDASKIGRNDPCPCGSGLKYKKCHGK